VIDAAENNWPSYDSLRHYHVARYFSVTEHSMAPAVVIFSKRVWDTLSKQDQSIIRGAARESVPMMRGLWDDYETSGRKTVEAAGGEVMTDVDKKAFADALVPLYSTIVDNEQLRAMVRRIQNDE
jgi:TRAP-type C4-dicarboxylate transport system substrate-binding protein